MIRPSGLSLAEHCGAAARLSEEFPQGSEHTEHGIEIHRQIADALTSGSVPPDPGAKQAVEIIRGLDLEILGVEVPVRLEDPETGELVSEGTGDLALKIPGGVWAIDHKTGQPDRVPQPEDALQFHAYGAGLALQHGFESYRVSAMHIRDGRAWMGRTQDVSGEEFWRYLARIKKAASRGPEPIVGSHCSGCFVQAKCPAFMLPAYQGETALAPFTRPNGLTHDNAAQALLVVQAMKEAIKVADERLKEFARRAGPIKSGKMEWGPNMVKGKRRGPTVKELEAAGMHDLIKEGEPSERFDWRKVR